MTSASNNRVGTNKTTVQKAAQAVGAVFVLVGILASSRASRPITRRWGFAGHGSGALLLGLFQVSILHNLVHLLYGVAGLAMARTASGARSYLLYGGIVYLVLWLYGLFIDKQSAANFVPLNTADDWLHFVLGVGMIALALALGRNANRTARSTSRL
jgi:hypothetical protein